MWKSSRALAAVALMIVVGLSGCAGGDAGPAETDNVKKVDGQKLENIKEGEGALRGTVTDDVGFALGEAKVALVGTTHIALTDAKGKFLFTNVTVGQHRLYVQMADHEPAESMVDIVSGELLELSVVLLPTVQKGAGYRPHIHDFWGDKTELLVIDNQPFEYHEPYDDTGPYSESFGRYYDTVTAGNVHPCAWKDDEVYFNNRLVWFDEADQLVVPGTKQIEISVDWDAADYPYHTDYALAWAGANTTIYTESEMIQQGESYFIDVEAKDWDSSHMSFSQWELWVCLDKESDEDVPRMQLGDIRVTAKLHRMEGDIPFEEAHPIFWPESGKIVVRDEAAEPVTLGGGVYTSRSTYNSVFVIRPDEGTMVPPGTSHVIATLEWPTSCTALEDYAFSLTYRPANERWYDKEDPADLLKAEKIDQGSGYAEYQIQPENVQSDQFYQKKSNWMFMLNLEGQEDDWSYTSPCPNTAIPVDVTITAYKDAEFIEG